MVGLERPTSGSKPLVYRLLWPGELAGGVAYVPDGFPEEQLDSTEPVREWTGFTLELRDGGFVDFQANDAAVPLCSAKMRSVIESVVSAEDRIDWLGVQLAGEGERRPYFIPHVITVLDVIDKSKSVMATPEFVIKPHLRLDRVGNHDIFVCLGEDATTLSVSDKLRRALLAAGCVGCAFWRIPGS